MAIQKSNNMTLQQFADKYCVCKNTVGNWRNKGYLRVLKVGRRVLITPEMEAEFITTHTTEDIAA